MSNILVQRFLNMFGEPDCPNVAAYVAEYVTALDGFGAKELDAAASSIIRNPPKRMRKLGHWPSVEECVQAAAKARQASKTVPKDNRHPEESREAYAYADAAIMSPLGRQAAAEGWVGALHDWLRRHRTTPGPHDVVRIMRDHAAFAAALRACEAGQGGSVGRPLLALGKAIQARHQRLADRATDGVIE